MTTAQRLTQVRKETGNTQAAFAKLLGVSPRAYASYELGERDLPSSFVQRLHKELKISPAWLLVGEGPRTRDVQSENIQLAANKVRNYASSKSIEIEPNDEARLIAVVTELLDSGTAVDSPLIKQILEAVT